jgi:hypothetical protein
MRSICQIAALVIAVVALPIGVARAADCTPDKYGSSPDCPATAYCPHSQCLKCAAIQGTDAGDGGPAPGCEECGPKGRCVRCAKISNCTPAVVPKVPANPTQDPCPPKCKSEPPAMRKLPDLENYSAPQP